MANLNKAPSSPDSSYKLAAAARRARIASMATPMGEVKPVQGRIRVKLGGKPLSRERQTVLFELSSIDIPEFSIVRNR